MFYCEVFSAKNYHLPDYWKCKTESCRNLDFTSSDFVDYIIATFTIKNR